MFNFLLAGGNHYDWTTPHLPNFNSLLEQFKGKRGVSFLEIGCYEGNTSRFLMENYLSEKGSTLTCIDPSPKRLFYRNCFSDLLKNKVKLYRMNSFKALVRLATKRKQYDFIYIDGSHLGKNVLEDSAIAFNLLKKGGILLFDDYGLNDHRVVDDYYDNKELLEKHTVSNTGELPMFESYFSPKAAIDSFLNIYSLDLEVLIKDYQVAIKKKDSYSETHLIYGRRPFSP